MSVAGTPGPARIVALAVDPLVQPPSLTFRGAYIQQTMAALHPPFQTFISRVTQAAQNDIRLLGAGQSEANLVASLKAFTSLQGGLLQAQLERVARRLPGGDQYLYNSPQGTVPGGYPTGAPGALDTIGTPYAFKVCAMKEAELLGYQNVLWMDVSLIPSYG